MALKILCALCCTALCMTGIYGEEPVIRAGIFSDTHLHKRGPSQGLVKKAFEFFKSKNVDMVIHTGDLSNVFEVPMYHYYRKTFNEVFAGKKPVEIITYADHDIIGLKNMNRTGKYALFKKELQIPHEPFALIEFKGYPFIVTPWPARVKADPGLPDFKEYEAKIKDVAKKYPGKPIFIAEHLPPANTVSQSNHWNHYYIHHILKKYPSVIHLSGHTHGSMKNEAMIWQGEYTAFNAGTLQVWHGHQTGGLFSARGKPSHDVTVMEVYGNKVVFRCFCIDDGKEYRKGNPWTVTLPYDRTKAPYSPAVRRKTCPVPEFPADARLKASFDPTFDFLTLTIPAFKDPEKALRCRITLSRKEKNGKWLNFARHDCDSNFYKNGPDLFQPIQVKINAGYFEPGRKYRITVCGENFFDVGGRELSLELKAPGKRTGKVVFESKDVAKECPFLYYGKTPYKAENGWFTYRVGRNYLRFPKGIWDQGKRYRLTAHIHTLFDNKIAHIFLNGEPGTKLPSVAYGRTLSCNDTVPQRYVWDIKKSRKGNYQLQIWQGKHLGKIRFDSIKLEVLE